MAQHPEYPAPMDINAIKRCIPHRFPFLQVDRILDYSVNEFVTGIRAISYSDPILQGHFPVSPVFPGVLIVEGLAQCAAILGHVSTEGGCSECLLTEVAEARFRRPVVPGDVLRYEATLVKRRPPFFWFEAKALVGDQLAATVKFSALMK